MLVPTLHFMYMYTYSFIHLMIVNKIYFYVTSIDLHKSPSPFGTASSTRLCNYLEFSHPTIVHRWIKSDFLRFKRRKKNMEKVKL